MSSINTLTGVPIEASIIEPVARADTIPPKVFLPAKLRLIRTNFFVGMSIGTFFIFFLYFPSLFLFYFHGLFSDTITQKSFYLKKKKFSHKFIFGGSTIRTFFSLSLFYVCPGAADLILFLPWFPFLLLSNNKKTYNLNRYSFFLEKSTQ